MIVARVLRDNSGNAAVEFILTAPFFLLIVFGIIELGLLLWTQIALQHGAEMAARCASINANTCGSQTQIQTFAAQQSYGLNPPTSVFTVTTPECGNQVQASYDFSFVTELFGTPTITISAGSCFPK